MRRFQLQSSAFIMNTALSLCFHINSKLLFTPISSQNKRMKMMDHQLLDVSCIQPYYERAFHGPSLVDQFRVISIAIITLYC